MTNKDKETIISALTMARNAQRLSADVNTGTKRIRAEAARMRYAELLQRIELGAVTLGAPGPDVAQVVK